MSKKTIMALILVGIVAIAAQHIYVLPIHIGTLLITIAAVVSADFLALLWMLGKKEYLDRAVMNRLHNVVSAGLLVMITSGAFLFFEASDYYLTLMAFRAKIFFVAVLVLNSYVITKHMHIPSERSFASLSAQERKPLIISGVISTVSWLSAFVMANFLN